MLTFSPKLVSDSYGGTIIQVAERWIQSFITIWRYNNEGFIKGS